MTSRRDPINPIRMCIRVSIDCLQAALYLLDNTARGKERALDNIDRSKKNLKKIWEKVLKDWK